MERKEWKQAQRAEMFDLLSERTAEIELALNGDVALIRGLAAYIRIEPDSSQDEFSAFASQLMKNRKAIVNMGAAPDMIIHVWYTPF